MHTHEFELSVGDVLQLGEVTVTVIDIENGEVTFRVDDGQHHEEDFTGNLNDQLSAPLPR